MTERQLLDMVRSVVDGVLPQHLHTHIDQDQYARMVILIGGMIPTLGIPIVVGRVMAVDDVIFCSVSANLCLEDKPLADLAIREFNIADPTFFEKLEAWVTDFTAGGLSHDKWNKSWQEAITKG
jgi:hypothetical protein